MRTPKKGSEGYQTVDRKQCGSSGLIILVLNLLVLQIVLAPSALATSVLPPSDSSVQTAQPIAPRLIPNITTESSELISTIGINSSQGLPEDNSTSTTAFETTECFSNCTTPSYSGGVTTEHTITSVKQSEISTPRVESTITVPGLSSTKEPDSVNHTVLVTSMTSPLPSQSLLPTSTPHTSQPTTPQVSTSYTSTDGTTSLVIAHSTTPIPSDQPSSTGLDSVSPSLSVTPFISPSVTPNVIRTIQPTQAVDSTATQSASTNVATTQHSSTQKSALTTPNKVLTKSPSTGTIAMTTDMSKSGLLLTTQQWIGIGIAIAAVLVMLGIACLLLTWARTRHNLLNKKPTITVTREAYSQSNTLERKDPQWRKSLTMALQSMNTHIELPKETDEEMQAVDNLAYVEESHDPQTSNQDSSHLTKV